VRALKNLTGEVTPATVAAALGSAKDVVLPAGHGNTFTCDSAAIPGLAAVCSAKGITGTMSGGKLDDVRTVDPSSLLAQ
jgi:branched-chain amino acid transport system substrate-binding protein